ERDRDRDTREDQRRGADEDLQEPELRREGREKHVDVRVDRVCPYDKDRHGGQEQRDADGGDGHAGRTGRRGGGPPSASDPAPHPRHQAAPARPAINNPRRSGSASWALISPTTRPS